MAEEVKTAAAEGESGSKNFIDAFIEEDIAEGGRFQGQQVHTRFPPEPNGYLHIGHCKALTIDFGTAERFGGLCNLRMDDTNPTKEDVEFVDAIKEDIHWLGFDWGDRFFYGSDYFEKDYEYAVELIKKGLAYVCDLTPEEAKRYRVQPYIDNMGDMLAAADLVLSRSGASSVAEIAALAVPSVLVPYPHATADHQTTNARYLVDAGAGVLCADADIDGSAFADELLHLVDDAAARDAMRQAARGLAQDRAAALLADAVEGLR